MNKKLEYGAVRKVEFKIKTTCPSDVDEGLKKIVVAMKKDNEQSKPTLKGVVNLAGKLPKSDWSKVQVVVYEGEFIMWLQDKAWLEDAMVDVAVAASKYSQEINGYSNEGDPEHVGKSWEIFNKDCYSQFSTHGIAECYNHFGKTKSIACLVKF